MKYVGTTIMFREIPDEISLGISISECTIKCKDCNSKYLWDSIGDNLNEESLKTIIESIKDCPVTFICFMGGNYEEVNSLCKYIHENSKYKTGWYTGEEIWQDMFIDSLEYEDGKKDTLKYGYFDFIKTGPFIKEKGGLDSPTTNQKAFMRIESSWYNITKQFQYNKK